jgi:hypothetical protein
MEITLSTPALLFPAISLLMLAYTNRFVVLANLIRSLLDKYKTNPDRTLIGQIRNLRLRVELIKYMQGAGVLSLLFCVLCMFLLFGGYLTAGKVLFAISLLLMVASLALSFAEIWISVNALNLHLSDLEEESTKHR